MDRACPRLEASSNDIESSALLAFAERIGCELIEQRLDESTAGLALAGGVAGYALFSACLAHARDPGHQFSDFAHRCLQRIATDLPQTDFVPPGLFTGLSGIAWATQYVSDLLGLDDRQRLQTDDAVCDFIEAYLDRDEEYEYDLINGLAGIGLWALTLPDESRRARIVARILHLLQRSSESSNGGITWRTPAVRWRRLRKADPHPEYNLGLAHGVPGVIGLLAVCIEQRIQHDQAESLLRKTLAWMASQLREGLSAFPNAAHMTIPSRAAWCYGDPGIAVVLHRAARVLDSKDVSALARAVTARFCARKLDDALVVDASFCHGSAGLIHICRRLEAYDASTEIGEARRYWLRLLLDQRRPDRGVCGFPYWDGQSRRYARCFGFLNGACGVGLTLLRESGYDLPWSAPALLA